MVSEETNRTLTQVGPGTPMGELLRRYWQPIAAVAELDDHPVKRVRLLGEDLVLYRDERGAYGLLDLHCPHRGADLSYGTVERCGLRCSYHGWAFNEAGDCIEQPFEEIARPQASFKDRVKTKAYPVEAKAGLIWAYLGPRPAPLVPTWEPFVWENLFVQIVFAIIPCNWLQCQENSIDPVHFEWLHTNWSQTLRGVDAKAPTHLRIAFDEIEWGFVYRRLLEGASEDDPLWTIGRVCLWPNGMFTGTNFGWRVPIDDETTLNVTWVWEAVPPERRPFRQSRIPYWTSPIVDPHTGRWITSHVANQDILAWVGQGRIADRTKEHLGETDRGIILLRQRLLDEARAVAEGREPKGVVRDPAQNASIVLPIVDRERLLSGTSVGQGNFGHSQLPSGGFDNTDREFVSFYGQPADVRAAYRAAMGLEGPSR